VGDKDLAIEQLGAAFNVPATLHYGNLKLQPFWDPLRGDPCFEKNRRLPGAERNAQRDSLKEKTKKIKQKATKRTKVFSLWDRAESLFPSLPSVKKFHSPA